METHLVVAIIAAIVALSSAAVTIWGQLKSTRLSAELEALRAAEQRRAEAEKTISRYREPLARAAYDLQSRLFNIIKKDLTDFLKNGTEREQAYIIDNTVFLIAQYFAWTEIIRQEIQFINLGEDEQTRRLAHLQDTIYSIWQTDAHDFDPLFRVFAGEQRAIGEELIREGSRGVECIGYGAFLNDIALSRRPLLEALRSDVRQLENPAMLRASMPRLAAMQNALIDLLAFLDPGYIRFSADRRKKVTLETPPNAI